MFCDVPMTAHLRWYAIGDAVVLSSLLGFCVSELVRFRKNWIDGTGTISVAIDVFFRKNEFYGHVTVAMFNTDAYTKNRWCNVGFLAVEAHAHTGILIRLYIYIYMFVMNKCKCTSYPID